MVEITVIVPVYNVENLVERCLNSLVSQSFKNFEILVIVDGSTDGSAKIVEKFKEKYADLIRVFYQENKGLSESRNVGVRLSTGKYIYFIDSDDYIEQDALSTMHQLAEEYSLDFVVDGFKTVTEDGEYIEKFSVDYTSKNVLINPSEDKDFFTVYNSVCNRLYLRSTIVDNKLKFIPGLWYEDVIFTRQYFVHSKRAMVIDELFYNYVQRDGSIMTNNASDKNRDISIVFRNLLVYLKEQGKLELFHDELEYRAIVDMFIATSARLIRGSNYKAVSLIDHDFKEMFPEYKNNIYLERLPLNSKIIFKLLNLKFYTAIKVIFRIYKGR